MQIFRKIQPNLLKSSSLALGMFDGVHAGHKMVISNAVAKADFLNVTPAIVAFANHPQCVTCKTPTKQLTTLEERLGLFKSLGIKAALILEFTPEFSEVTAYNYLKNILIEGLNARSITIGYDHCFGAGRLGDYNFLLENIPQFGYEVDVIPPIAIDGQIVSSSIIRNLIAIGKVDIANKLLERFYSLNGIVVEGKKRGAGLGFPTANLMIKDNIVVPAIGTYAGFVELDGNKYKAVINIGKNPTFGDIENISVEIHILNFSANIYEKQLKTYFVKRLRDEKKFASSNELSNQIKSDCDIAASILSNL